MLSGGAAGGNEGELEAEDYEDAWDEIINNHNYNIKDSHLIHDFCEEHRFAHGHRLLYEYVIKQQSEDEAAGMRKKNKVWATT